MDFFGSLSLFYTKNFTFMEFLIEDCYYFDKINGYSYDEGNLIAGIRLWNGKGVES